MFCVIHLSDLTVVKSNKRSLVYDDFIPFIRDVTVRTEFITREVTRSLNDNQVMSFDHKSLGRQKKRYFKMAVPHPHMFRIGLSIYQ